MCCLLEVIAQAEDNDRPATRHDVVHAEDIRRRERAEQGAAYAAGYFIGDVIVDSSAMIIGGAFGVMRASALSVCGKNPKREEPILGIFDRKEVDEIDLFDSCSCCTDCCS